MGHKIYLVLGGNSKVGNPMLFCFFVQSQHKFLYKNHLLYYMYAYFLKQSF